jgi:plastocyanin
MLGVRIARALAALLLLAPALVTTPVSAASLEAIVRDAKGKPVEDAVVYLAGAAPTAGAPATMDQVEREFVPHVLPIQVGTAVRFPNRDNIRHHVYSLSAVKKFELPLYSGTPAAPIVFDKPGVVALGCNIHDWMVAYIYVLETPFFAKTGADGQARLENVPAGAHEVRVWHPRLKAATETTGQRVAAGAAEPLQFVIGLKRDWRMPQPARPRYEQSRGWPSGVRHARSAAHGS